MEGIIDIDPIAMDLLCMWDAYENISSRKSTPIEFERACERIIDGRLKSTGRELDVDGFRAFAAGLAPNFHETNTGKTILADF